jgi:hypothetical protein
MVLIVVIGVACTVLFIRLLLIVGTISVNSVIVGCVISCELTQALSLIILLVYV